MGAPSPSSVGYGDQLVQFASDLSVDAGSHPSDIPDRMDLDFVGSPVVFSRPGCGQLVAATDKDDTVYLWRAGSIARRPGGRDPPRKPTLVSDPMLAQLAWSPSLELALHGHRHPARADHDRGGLQRGGRLE